MAIDHNRRQRSLSGQLKFSQNLRHSSSLNALPPSNNIDSRGAVNSITLQNQSRKTMR